MAVLGIDAGATATKWVISDGQNGSTLAMDGHVGNDNSLLRMQEVVKEIAAHEKGEITSVWAGITGFDSTKTGREIIEDVFKKAFPHAKLTLMNDMELAYRAHFDLGGGILLYSGTGSIASYMDSEGAFHRTGGWGYLLGDAGSGYWIGREGIRHALWQMESGDSFDCCTEKIMQAINAKNWPDVRTFVYSNERSKVAALAKIIIKAAEEGHEKALEIMTDAADELSAIVHRLEKRTHTKNLPVHLDGGVGRNSNILLAMLTNRLGERIEVANVDIARRACELASN